MAQEKWMTRFARQRRSGPTIAEMVLWQELRRSALGYRFRREDPIGPYIADFSCRFKWLIVECDGASHTDPEKDAKRDRWFHEHGWFVLRFDDVEVLDHLEWVLDTIVLALEDPSQVLDPLNLNPD